MSDQKHKKQLLDQIYEAAMELFSEKPYASVTMDEVAKRAGCSKRALYNHVASKSDLLVDIFEQKLQELYETERAAFQGCCSAEEVIYTHIRELNSFAKRNHRFVLVYWSLKDYIGEDRLPKEKLSKVIYWNKMTLDQAVSHLISKERKGLLSCYEPEIIVHYLSAVSKGIFLQYEKETTLDIQSPSWDDLSAFSIKCIQCFLEHP